ncbi:MAG: type II toxin-antitoxin system HipA family toxin [Prolixibacteraceae bacterium]|jgi:serine/threonine-protein kinase HipA|nr:type II toxin-antitoxin system HipA family toxin [Prolixibacteraceae bacterium]
MVSAANILLWGNNIGAVIWDEKRMLASVEFAPSFAKLGLNVAPLTMPLSEIAQGNRLFSFPGLNRETFSGLPGLLADSLPDRFGNALLDAWLAAQGRTKQSVNPVERLCYTGSRGMGALIYEPSLRVSNNGRSEKIDVEHLVELARLVLNEKASIKGKLNNNSIDGLNDIIKVGTSAGGARAKAVIAYNETSGEMFSGQVDAPEGFSYWLIKFDGVTNKHLGDPEGYGRIEFAYYLMAIDCDIEMSECKLLTEGNRAHFMTKRFDRTNNSERFHMQTLCGIAHMDYNDPLSYAYEDAFEVMRLLRLPYPDAEQLYKRMVFNVMARNHDDHTKNISFLMNKQGIWKLAPAYDVTYAYNPESRWVFQHQMAINGKRQNITREDLLSVARNMNIKKANDIIDKVSGTLKKWNGYADKAGIPKHQANAIFSSFLFFE